MDIVETLRSIAFNSDEIETNDALNEIADDLENKAKNADTITRSLRLVNFGQPDPDTIWISDIAHHLSREQRFTNATDINVALHSCVGERCASRMGWTLQQRMHMLLHDAPEAYLRDMIHPFKKAVPLYDIFEGNLERVIAKKFQTEPHPDWKWLDDQLTSIEVDIEFANVSYFFKRYIETEDWIREVGHDHIAFVSDEKGISMDKSRDLFLTRFHALSRGMGLL